MAVKVKKRDKKADFAGFSLVVLQIFFGHESNH